jgi:hypothetical protein
VEIFSNLLWLALSSLFLGFWLFHRHSWADEPLRSSASVQFIALALLIVVLLPVVSLTDDLQACTMPAETEHLSRRGDFQAVADFSLHAVSVVVAGLFSFDAAPGPQTFAWLSLPADSQVPCIGYLCTLGNRSPPAA